jgi:hypothetical protein
MERTPFTLIHGAVPSCVGRSGKQGVSGGSGVLLICDRHDQNVKTDRLKLLAR